MWSQTLVSRPVAVSGDFATIVRHPDQKKKHIVDKKIAENVKIATLQRVRPVGSRPCRNTKHA